MSMIISRIGHALQMCARQECIPKKVTSEMRQWELLDVAVGEYKKRSFLFVIFISFILPMHYKVFLLRFFPAYYIIRG